MNKNPHLATRAEGVPIVGGFRNIKFGANLLNRQGIVLGHLLQHLLLRRGQGGLPTTLLSPGSGSSETRPGALNQRHSALGGQ